MTQHIGVKLINAFPMTRQAYNDFRGWQLPAGENGEDEGYLVEYLDGGKPNTDRFDGYVSWSPKEVFEKAYRPVSGLSFGLAIEALKLGNKVARAGWNGKGMWLAYVKPYTEAVHTGSTPCFCSRVFELPEGTHGEKKEKVFIYRDPLTGEPVSYYQQDIKDVIDDLANRGFIKVAERKVKRRRVYKSIITCTQILKDREKIFRQSDLLAYRLLLK